MSYITFFQFIRRCLLRDAERCSPPEQVLEHVEAVLGETEPGKIPQTNGTERTGGSGNPREVGLGGSG